MLHQVVPATYRVEGWEQLALRLRWTWFVWQGAPLALVKLVGFFVGIPDSVTFTVYESGAKQVEAGSGDYRNCCFYRVLH